MEKLKFNSRHCLCVWSSMSKYWDSEAFNIITVIEEMISGQYRNVNYPKRFQAIKEIMSRHYGRIKFDKKEKVFIYGKYHQSLFLDELNAYIVAEKLTYKEKR